MSLAGKKIILAVTGSIAAYKTPHFVRLLVKAGAEVRVIVTQAAAALVSPLALSTVSRHQVYTAVHDGLAWNNHVELGLWADIFVVAPCSANTLAKLANGSCDNIVTAVYLSARCPVVIAPAMDEDMWKHPATKANLRTVASYGCHVLPVGNGELASGLVGEGRMAEPEQMEAWLRNFFQPVDAPLNGMNALVTSGPTYERIDPVRFIGNFSTGKMGVALADALAEKGATVTLISGPSVQVAKHPRVMTQMVESAQEMYEASMAAYPITQIAVLAAAVADYRPSVQATEKIKKEDGGLNIELTKTIDILASLGKIKQPWQTLVGFALETENEQTNGFKKLVNKNADMIVLNSLKDAGAGFGHDTNKITLLLRSGAHVALPLQQKQEAAMAIVDMIIEMRNA